jgi:hypothetical protein
MAFARSSKTNTLLSLAASTGNQNDVSTIREQESNEPVHRQASALHGDQHVWR